MHTYYKATLVFAALAAMLPTSAAEFALSHGNTDPATDVQHALKLRRQFDLGQALDAPPALPIPTAGRRKGIVENCTCFSQESGAVRWLNLTLANKRAFVSYAAAQRGRPAELRFAIKLSLL